jgi:hypothetical protein
VGLAGERGVFGRRHEPPHAAMVYGICYRSLANVGIRTVMLTPCCYSLTGTWLPDAVLKRGGAAIQLHSYMCCATPTRGEEGDQRTLIPASASFSVHPGHREVLSRPGKSTPRPLGSHVPDMCSTLSRPRNMLCPRFAPISGSAWHPIGRCIL